MQSTPAIEHLFFFESLRLSDLDLAQKEDQSDFPMNASKKRRVEFFAGRQCAQKALSRMGLGQCQVVRSPSGEPWWPVGITGSISHSGEFACAVVSRKKDIVGVGIDIEEQGRIKPAMFRLIFTSREMDFLEKFEPEIRSSIATDLFSAKESLFKCVYPIFKKALDFRKIHIRVEQSRFHFEVDEMGTEIAEMAGRAVCTVARTMPQHTLTRVHVQA